MSHQLSLLSVGPRPAAPEASEAGSGFWRRTVFLSPCKKYRYLLTVLFGPSPKRDLWCLLNPSTTDAAKNDATLQLLLGLSIAWGSGGLDVVNLAAFASSDPNALLAAEDPIGPENDRYVREAAERCVSSGGRLVAGWGGSVRFDLHKPLLGRDAAVLKLLQSFGPVWCLARTASGAPKHPRARGKTRVLPGTEPLLFAPFAPALVT